MSGDRYADRRERLRAELAGGAEGAGLAGDGVDALLVTRPSNVRYLTGFTGSNGTVLLAGEMTVLATDGRYAEQAAAESPDVDIVVGRADDWLAPRGDGIAVLGVEGDQLPWRRALRVAELLGGAHLIDVSALVQELRARKDDQELGCIARACTITAQAMEAMFSWLSPGMTEREAAHRLLGEMLDRGADGPAFDFIVASGPNGARPHHHPGDRPLATGELVTFDAGARVDGYCADMTRTVALGQPPEELVRIYALVQRAQQAGVDAVGPGVSVEAVDAACRNVIAAAGRGDEFVHPSGHALGLDIHEPPLLAARRPDGDEASVARLCSRMAVTVEPGVYVPGLGGVRIEDVVVVNDRGCDVLTPTRKDLVVL